MKTFRQRLEGCNTDILKQMIDKQEKQIILLQHDLEIMKDVLKSKEK